MDRREAERITEEYLKPIFGFALKRCASLQDAEDLAQEVALKAFRILLVRDDIEDEGKFIWTIAHNALNNYYRDNKYKSFIGISIDEVAETLSSSEKDMTADLIEKETVDKLQSEIAYLSKLQRRIIIAHYYENKKQADIAKELDIPVGTVKWHLFEAKKNLKRGMETTMRTSSELKFNPVKFAMTGTSGSIGSKGNNSNFFRSILSQNIVYAVWKEAMTVNEIADALGVSPVYVEGEAEYLEEYGFLTKHGEKYLCNILLDEPTSELNALHDEVYEKTADIFANELFDGLMKSDILDNENMPKDKNFLLWALIPYIAASSGEGLIDKTISFEEAATLRPDGGHNVCMASVLNSDVTPPKYYENLKQFFGPCWNEDEKMLVWIFDSEWSAKRAGDAYQTTVRRDMSLLTRLLKNDTLSKDEYAYLAEGGYIEMIADETGHISPAKKCVFIDKDTEKALLSIGDKIREKYSEEFDKLKRPYIKAILNYTPKHLQTMQKYVLQFMFYSDGWFIFYCLKKLVDGGKLKLPADTQKKSLSLVIVDKKME